RRRSAAPPPRREATAEARREGGPARPGRKRRDRDPLRLAPRARQDHLGDPWRRIAPFPVGPSEAGRSHSMLGGGGRGFAGGIGGGVGEAPPLESILQVPSKNTPRSITIDAVVRVPRTLAGAFSSTPLDAFALP